jgi:SulP family sulfate permease
MNAQTPISGIIHAITVFGITILCGPLVSKIPLPALSAVLVFIGWNMFDFDKTKEILKGYKGEAIIMLLTLIITIFVDLNTAVQTGIFISIILFLKQSSDTTSGTFLLEVEEDEPQETQKKNGAWKRKLPDDIKLYEIEGPFFFAVTDLLSDVLNRFSMLPRILIVRMRSVPFIDSTGIDSLKQFSKQCQKKGVELFLAELKPSVLGSLEQSDFFKKFPKTRILASAKQAIHFSTITTTQISEENPSQHQEESQVLVLRNTNDPKQTI